MICKFYQMHASGFKHEIIHVYHKSLYPVVLGKCEKVIRTKIKIFCCWKISLFVGNLNFAYHLKCVLLLQTVLALCEFALLKFSCQWVGLGSLWQQQGQWVGGSSSCLSRGPLFQALKPIRLQSPRYWAMWSLPPRGEGSVRNGPLMSVEN